jgi:hypothetical protein
MVSAGLSREGFRLCVLSSDVGTDGLLEAGEGLEDAASDRSRVRAEKKSSTALSHDPEAGVK